MTSDSTRLPMPATSPALRLLAIVAGALLGYIAAALAVLLNS